MAEERNLLFDVVYGNKKSSFQLPKTATVAHLKNKLFQEFGIAPNQQIIECWTKKPRTDADTLITCCLSSVCNYLVVYHEKNSEQGSTVKRALGSNEYQQLMLDMLGDRDYDNFDRDEFNLLREKIGFALYGPPKQVTGYEKKELKKIDFLFEKIVHQNNLIAKWKNRVTISFIYICLEPLPKEKEKRAKDNKDYDPNSDMTPIPVFVLRKCKHSENPCRIFIDDIGRVYTSWEDYLSNNKLPECVMVYPKNGRYEDDENGNVIIQRRLSPACNLANDVLRGADIASTVGGMASGGMIIAGVAFPAVATVVIPVAVVTGAVIGGYSIARSSFSIHDRRIHKDNLNFFESAEARGAYINIVASSLGIVGIGANAVVAKLVEEGFHIGRGAITAVETVNILTMGAGGAGIVNGTCDIVRDLIYEKKGPSARVLIQLSSSLLFFGHAVYNYKSLGKIIDENQANLRKYEDSLRNNRHRKNFNKLFKETIRQNDGTVRKGQADVISTIKYIRNKAELFETATRTTFKVLDIRKPTTADVNNMTLFVIKKFFDIDSSEVGNLASFLAKFFAKTDSTIKDKILDAVSQIFKALLRDYSECAKMLDKIFPGNKYFQLTTMVNSFFQKPVNDLEEKYARWLKTQNPEDEEPCFLGFLSLSDVQRITKIFNIVTKKLYIGTRLTEEGLNKLLDYFFTWFRSQVHSYEENQERRQRRKQHGGPASKKSCKICGGYYYSP